MCVMRKPIQMERKVWKQRRDWGWSQMLMPHLFKMNHMQVLRISMRHLLEHSPEMISEWMTLFLWNTKSNILSAIALGKSLILWKKMIIIPPIKSSSLSGSLQKRYPFPWGGHWWNWLNCHYQGPSTPQINWWHQANIESHEIQLWLVPFFSKHYQYHTWLLSVILADLLQVITFVLCSGFWK